jgi:DNA-binding beta-propeller fold protein YncE
VPIYGNSGVGKPGTDGSNLVVIDLAAQKVVGNVDFGHGVRPHMPLFGPQDGLLYVTTELDQAIALIDPKTLKIVGSIPTGQPESHMLALSHDGRRGYTANVGPGTVSVLDIPGRKVVKIVKISGNTQRISISKDDRWVFTSDQTKPQLAMIDTRTNEVGRWIPLEGLGYGTAPTTDGRWLLVTMPASNKLAVIDLKTMTVARTVDTPADPEEVLAAPGGKTAWVSCVRSHTLAEVELATWKITRTIVVGSNSDGIAWAGR